MPCLILLKRLNYCTDGHHLSSSCIIVKKPHAQFCRPERILNHFMEPFNHVKEIHACQVECMFNERTNNPSPWCDQWIQAAGAQRGGWLPGDPRGSEGELTLALCFCSLWWWARGGEVSSWAWLAVCFHPKETRSPPPSPLHHLNQNTLRADNGRIHF